MERLSTNNQGERQVQATPLSFEHYVVNFSEGILTKVRKRLSQQLSTK